MPRLREAGRKQKQALQFWECRGNVSSSQPVFMPMLFLQLQNLCVVSNFIFLQENEATGAKTVLCFFRPSVVFAVKGFRSF